jgi:hypothetical protein
MKYATGVTNKGMLDVIAKELEATNMLDEPLNMIDILYCASQGFYRGETDEFNCAIVYEIVTNWLDNASEEEEDELIDVVVAQSEPKEPHLFLVKD